MNTFIGMGRLTRDPEIKVTQSGTSVATFTLAIDRKYKDKSGEKKTDFINCTSWRNTAEFIGKYARKGTKLIVTGEIQTRTYDDKDGKKVYVTEVVVESVEFAESKRDEEKQVVIEADDDTTLPFDL
jgi:single-strand DNA-binding protein